LQWEQKTINLSNQVLIGEIQDKNGQFEVRLGKRQVWLAGGWLVDFLPWFEKDLNLRLGRAIKCA